MSVNRDASIFSNLALNNYQSWYITTLMGHLLPSNFISGPKLMRVRFKSAKKSQVS